MMRMMADLGPHYFRAAPAVEHPILEAAVVIVGAGPAGLACALRLAQLLDADGGNTPGLPSKDAVCLLEKGREVGAHLLSGAVLDPGSLRQLLAAEFAAAPLGPPVGEEGVFFLSARRAWRLPLIPPPLRNHGNCVVSLNRLGKWLGEKVEAAGVTVFTATAGERLLWDDARAVVGVRTDDKGVDRQGRAKANFEPGADLRAPLVVLAEGPRGSLTKQLLDRLDLAGRNPQVYGLGVKEVWEVPPGRIAAGEVRHTLGWPTPPGEYGGGWIYGVSDHEVSLGLVTALEYRDPGLDPFELMQRLKTHAWTRALLAGGERVRYGAKTMPLGGYYSRPPAAGRGWIIIGDSAGYLNSQRLKGIHLAITSGILAAEAIFAAWRGDAGALRGHAARVEASPIGRELWRTRNFHQGFVGGMIPGMLRAGAQMLTGGRGWRSFQPTIAGHRRLRRLGSPPSRPPRPDQPGAAPPPAEARLVPDGKLTFDKLSDVYHSGTRHQEDQPPHLIIHDTDICNGRCVVEYGNPCRHFCPAQVYEMVPGEDGAPRIHLNPSNCVHCKTCDIMDPYEIITWVPPEGGGGPNYEGE